MLRSITNCFVFAAFPVVPLVSFGQKPVAATAAESKEWVTKSNSYTKILIDIDEKYSPEFGSDEGFAFYDTLIAVPTLVNVRAQRNDKESALVVYRSAKQKETDIKVRQDLDILINNTELGFREQDFE